MKLRLMLVMPLMLTACSKLKISGEGGMIARVQPGVNGSQSNRTVPDYNVKPQSIVFAVANPNPTLGHDSFLYWLDVDTGAVSNQSGSVLYKVNTLTLNSVQELLAHSMISTLEGATGRPTIMSCEYMPVVHPDGTTSYWDPGPSWYALLETDKGTFYLGDSCDGGPDLFNKNTNPNASSSGDLLYEVLVDTANQGQIVGLSVGSNSLNWITPDQLVGSGFIQAE